MRVYVTFSDGQYFAEVFESDASLNEDGVTPLHVTPFCKTGGRACALAEKWIKKEKQRRDSKAKRK